MYKKLLVLLLCGIMLISVFAGCAEVESGDDSTGGNNDEQTQWVSADLEPNEDLKGKEINILCNSETDMGPDEPEKSDPLEDAVYRINDKIQNYYGVKLNGLNDSEVSVVALATDVLSKNDINYCKISLT